MKKVEALIEEGVPLAQAMRTLPPVRTLPDLLLRCEVCEDTGCWEWLGYMDTRGKTPMVRMNGEPAKNARNVARLLAGLKLRQGYRTIPGAECSVRCINPAHTRHVTAAKFMRTVMLLGGRQSPVQYAAIVAASRKRSTSLIGSVEQADEIRRRLADGESGKALATEFGCTPQNINLVGQGKAWMPVVVPGSSVFALGAA